MTQRLFCCLSYIIVLLGAVNWGIIGIFDFNLVDALLGRWGILPPLLYILIGVAGLWNLVLMAGSGGRCLVCMPRDRAWKG